MIKKNSAQCGHCKDILISRGRHDWVCCSCWSDSEDKHGIFIDGGHSYFRYGYKNKEDFINLTEYYEE